MIIFSGTRPTGRLHIGNYLGAIKNWLELQQKHDCIFAIVDLHGITTPFNPKTIKQDILNVVLDYLAAGLDPKKSKIIIQSHIPEHLELAWILSTITPLSWLQRIPTFKEKVALHPEYVNVGLLCYPVLMAADILLYKATLVPIGEDQLPHVEITNEIARRFNKMFGETFQKVKPYLGKGARIMSLQNPKQKMSKTGGEGILLSDPPSVIKRKIKKAVTDSGKEIIYEEKTKPAISNLILIYSLFSNVPIKEVEKKFKGKGYEEFKENLSKLIISALAPFREKRKKLKKEPTKIKEILGKGEKEARIIAQKTLLEVKKKIGLT